MQADYFTGNLSSATHRLRTALGAEPDSPLWNAWLGRLLLARRLPRAAIPHLERALAVDPDAAGVVARLGIARARADDPKAAAAALAALDERARAGGPRSSEARALLLLELGRPDEAVEALEEAWRAGEPGLLHLSHDPELHRLRAHPRFSKLVARARSH